MRMDSTEEAETKPVCSWRVEEADEAKYNFSDKKGLWQPKPADILSVFEQLTKQGALPLKWTCPGRRAPESESLNDEETAMDTEMETDELKEESQNPEPSAFDFDDTGPDSNVKVTPWRSAGIARTPKTEKRVARMDNIMDSLRKQQMQRNAERDARKTKSGTPSRFQQGRGRLIKFGTPSPKKTSPVSSSASTPFAVNSTAVSSESSMSAVVTSSAVTAPSTSTLSNDVTAPTSVQILPGTATLSTSEVHDMKSMTTTDVDIKLEAQVKSEEGNQETKAGVDTSSVVTDTVSSPKSSFVTISSGSRKKSASEVSSGDIASVGPKPLDEKVTETFAAHTSSPVVTSTSTSSTTSTSNSNNPSSNVTAATPAPSATTTTPASLATTTTPAPLATTTASSSHTSAAVTDETSLPNTATTAATTSTSTSAANNSSSSTLPQTTVPSTSTTSTASTATEASAGSGLTTTPSSSSTTTATASNPPSERTSHTGDTQNQPTATSLPDTSTVTSNSNSTPVSTVGASTVSPMETD